MKWGMASGKPTTGPLRGWSVRVGTAVVLATSGLLSWAMLAEGYYEVAAKIRPANNSTLGSVATCTSHSQPLPDTKPGYLQPVRFDRGKRTLTRITDPLGVIPDLDLRWGRVARHHYSLDQPWNADKSLLVLDRGTSGQLYLDGTSYEPLFIRKAAGEARWHPLEPDLQVLVDGRTLNLFDVRSDRVIPVAEFDGYSDLAFGPNKGNPSDDGGMVALLAGDPKGRQVVFAYDLAGRRKFPDIDLSDKEVNYATISPSGRYIIVRGTLWPEIQPKGDQTEVLDLVGRRVGAWAEYGRPSHFDLGYDQTGEEVAVGISKVPPHQWQIIKRRLRDGAVTALSAPGGATHVSLRNTQMPGWAFVTYAETSDRKGWLPYHREVVALKLDGGGHAVPIVQTRSTGRPYEAEAHAVPAPDGCEVVFASDWGRTGGKVSAFVADSPICASRDNAVPALRPE